jgi:hypothetical protein
MLPLVQKRSSVWEAYSLQVGFPYYVTVAKVTHLHFILGFDNVNKQVNVCRKCL